MRNDLNTQELMNTIAAMRDQLEALHHEKDKAVHKATEAANAEISQLKTMVKALRDELERAHFEADERVRDAVERLESEIVQLRASISVLRDELELKELSIEERLDQERLAHRDLKKELEQTILSLRRQLAKTREMVAG